MNRLPLRFPLTALSVLGIVAMAIILPTAFGASAPAPAPVRKALARSAKPLAWLTTAPTTRPERFSISTCPW